MVPGPGSKLKTIKPPSFAAPRRTMRLKKQKADLGFVRPQSSVIWCAFYGRSLYLPQYSGPRRWIRIGVLSRKLFQTFMGSVPQGRGLFLFQDVIAHIDRRLLSLIICQRAARLPAEGR